MRYLDPKADLTFKKVFGEHKDLLISLLNALLPLSGDEQVESVEYLPAELVPDLPMGKNSIVDVRCKDLSGRQFIVEMQMIWTPAFQQRVLFNASKPFVRQLRRNRKYELLQPVYSLNLVNETFMNDYPDEFIHNYNIVHELHSAKTKDAFNLSASPKDLGKTAAALKAAYTEALRAARFGSKAVPGEASTPTFNVPCKVRLTFKAAPYQGDDNTVDVYFGNTMLERFFMEEGKRQRLQICNSGERQLLRNRQSSGKHQHQDLET